MACWIGVVSVAVAIAVISSMGNGSKTIIIPIPGTTKLQRLEENVGGADIELTKEELYSLNKSLSKIDILIKSSCSGKKR